MLIAERSMKTRVYLLAGLLVAWCCPLLAEDWQKGEPILPAASAPADAPLRRNAKSPWYELSNLRRDNTLVKGALSVDYKRVGPLPMIGLSEIVLVSKGAAGRREYRLSAVQDEGTMNGAAFSTRNEPTENDLEVWVECRQMVGKETFRIKVSRSITLGSVGQLTFAREWNADEQRAFDQLEKSLKPPEEAPPAPYRVATHGTKLLPGMPVLAGLEGQWKPAEIIDVRADGTVLLKYNEGAAFLVARTRDWIAVDEATLAKATADPGQFKPSVKVLPGGTAPITHDLVAVDKDTPIVKGTPLLADFAGHWFPVTVAAVFNDGSLRVRWDRFRGAKEETRTRDRLMITAETLAILKKSPNAAELFAKRAEIPRDGAFGNRNEGPFGRRHQGPFGRGHSTHLHDYPIDIPIPKFAVRVTDETSLHEGMKLGACFGRRWWDITVLEVNNDDTVRVHWDKLGDAWDGDISRNNLIIAKKDLEKSPAKSARKLASKSLASEQAATPKATAGESRYRVVLKSFGNQRVAVTKAVADITGLDLKDAKEFVESAPLVLKQNLTKADALKIFDQLQDSGATVAIELQ